MPQRVIIDTNIIVRHIVGDHEQHARAAGKLFDACDRRDLTLALLPAVLSECVFVLESFYKHPRPAIATVLKSLISSPGIEISDLPVHLDALDRYARGKMHFVDCSLAAFAAATKCPVASFDQEFKKISDITVFKVS